MFTEGSCARCFTALCTEDRDLPLHQRGNQGLKDSSPGLLNWEVAEPEPRQPEPHSLAPSPGYTDLTKTSREGLNGLEKGGGTDAVRGH